MALYPRARLARLATALASAAAAVQILVFFEWRPAAHDSALRAMGLLAACAAAVAASIVLRWTIMTDAELLATIRRFASGDFSARARGLGAAGEALDSLGDRIQGAVGDLARDKAQLSAVLNQMTEAVVAVDSHGTVLVVNPALSRLLKVDPSRAKGRPYLETLRNNGLVELISSVLGGASPAPVEIRLAREDLVFDAHAAPLAEGGALVVLHDITRLRRLEQVRRDFVANVGHELRTPLASIKGYAETLKNGALDDHENRVGFVLTIEEHADRLSKLVDDLLDLSAIESGHRQPRFESVPVLALAVEVARELKPQADAAGVQVHVAELPALPPALADRGHLRQILANLVDNAIKYNERGGRVDISAAVDAGYLQITVSDTGVGIPEADLPRVFERFYRVDKARSRDAGGTGLGLAIVKHLVEIQGGETSVESRRPGGSSFRFTLRASA